MMRYFFILGSSPAFSIAEIFSVLKAVPAVSAASRQALIIDSADPIDLAGLMQRLGGTVKIGAVDDGAVTVDALPAYIKEKLLVRLPKDKRLAYGVSFYPLKNAPLPRRLAVLGLDVKKLLKAAGVASRLVRPSDGLALNSVSVTKNHLLAEGAEIVVFIDGAAAAVGETAAVQPFEEFSKSDYGRPSRDMIQGMLPPKLARMMINIAGVSSTATILDPFCGSGTILTEALRLGYADIYGSDKNPAAVESAKNNIDWIAKNIGLATIVQPRLAVADARTLAKHFPPRSVDAVITEPFLGPPRTGRERRGALQKTLSEIEKLYYETLSALRPLLKPDATIVIALPVYILGREKHGTSVKPFEKLGYRAVPLAPANILNSVGAAETKNRGLLYGRDGQYVWREIVKLAI